MFFLSLLSCQELGIAGPSKPADPQPMTIAETAVARPAPLPMPTSALVVRECFGGRDQERVSSRPGPQPVPPPPPTARPPSAPAGAARPATTGTSSATASRAKSEEARSGAPAPAADQPLATAAPEPPAMEAQKSIGYLSGGEGASLADRGGWDEAEEDAAQGRRESPAKKDSPRSMTPAEPAWTPPEANLDWGATVYLSNDDSMSLASAQRLLWAVQKKGAVSASQVRPHELLNYFSFETAPVAPGDTFSVLASAESTAPDTLTLALAVKGKVPERVPLDLTVVLDRSGSMSAEGRMDYLKRGLTKMSENLRPGDRVDMVLFDHEVCTPLENFVVGRDDPAILSSAIGRLQPRGSTDLDLGLEEGYRIAMGRGSVEVQGRNRRMMLISDALLNTGDVDPNTVSEVGRAYEQGGVRLTAIGVGREFNDQVLDMLSEKGKGAYVYLGSEAVVDRVFGVGFESLTRTIAHDVRFSLDLPPSLAMQRFYGEESSTNREEVQPIHYYAGTTQLFLQDLKLRSPAPVASDPVTLTVEFTDADTGLQRTQVFTSTVGALLRSDPRNLHKGRALMAWTDLILARALGSQPCGAPFAAWRERVGAVGPDAELGWLDGLTSPLCGQAPVAVRRPTPTAVGFKVKVDSDLPIPEVQLTCSEWSTRESLSGSDTIASFVAPVGACTLTLQGTVPMSTAVQVPATGADIRCVVRAGRMSCG